MWFRRHQEAKARDLEIRLARLRIVANKVADSLGGSHHIYDYQITELRNAANGDGELADWWLSEQLRKLACVTRRLVKEASRTAQTYHDDTLLGAVYDMREFKPFLRAACPKGAGK